MLKRAYHLFLLISIFVYLLTYFVPTGHWVAGFLMMGVPVLMLFHAVSLVIAIVFKLKQWHLPLIGLGLSFPFWSRTFQFPMPKTSDGTLTVLSYNTMGFDMVNYLENKKSSRAVSILQTALNVEADIKCFQEFYNRENSDIFNSLAQVKAAGYPYHVTLRPDYSRSDKNFFGMVVFSKYQIVNSDFEVFGSDTNGALYADIVIKQDTIRLINVHLRSMIVRFGGVREAYKDQDYSQGKSEIRKIAGKLKRGFIHHREDISVVTKWIDRSPYPVLVCGDFNETPYSYTYGVMKKRLANAFEEAGNGFGFTYQNMPKVIRIDQQFYDSNYFEAVDFQTLSHIKHSDHYPILGKYRLKR